MNEGHRSIGGWVPHSVDVLRCLSTHPPPQKAWVWGWVLSRRHSLGSGRRSPVSHSLAPFQPLLLLTGACRMTPEPHGEHLNPALRGGF